MRESDDIRVKKLFVVSIDDGLNRGTTIRKLEGFFVEYFVVGVIGAKVLIYEFDEFRTKFDLDGLAEWEVVVGAFSSSVLFVINWCRFVLEGVIIIGVV